MNFKIALADRVAVLTRLNHNQGATPNAIASPVIRAAVELALDRGETHYTDRPGILPLRERVAASLVNRFGLALQANTDVVITCGVTEARFVATQQMLKPGEILLAPEDAVAVAGAACLRAAEVIGVMMPGVRMLYLTSRMTETKVREHMATVPEEVSILYELRDSESRFHPAQVAGFKGRTVTIGDLGDESWRIGYLASPSLLAPGMRDFKQALTICSTNLSQWAVLAGMEAQ